MTTNEKMELLSETLDVEPEEISVELKLEEASWWDSLAKLSLIVMFDDEFNKKITSDEIKQFITVKDIIEYMK